MSHRHPLSEDGNENSSLWTAFADHHLLVLVRFDARLKRGPALNLGLELLGVCLGYAASSKIDR